MRIRRATSKDYGAIEDLERECFGEDGMTPGEEAAWHWWAAIDGRRFAGYAAARFEGPEALFLCRAGVAEAYRGLGVQKKLIVARLKFAEESGCTRAITYTSVDNMASANNLISCGFKLYRPDFLWADRDWLYFQKKLTEE